MAIAFDAQSSSTFSSTSSRTNAHTCTGSNRFLLVAFYRESGVTISSATYAGVALTSITSVNFGADANKGFMIYGLANPASGANNIVVNYSGSGFNGTMAVSYTGVHQTTPVETSNTANPVGSSTTITANITVAVANTWAVAIGRFDNGGTLSGSDSTTQVRNNTSDGGNVITDSNASVSTGTITGGLASTLSGGRIIAVLNMEPVATAVTTNGSFLLKMI